MAMTVEEVQELLRRADREEFAALERSLSADSRKGVIRALEICRRRLAAEAAEQERLASLYGFDAAQGHGKAVMGLDEVGRGAVAGPLAVGAVVLPQEPKIPLLNDSKQLSPEQRASIAERIREVASAWTVVFIEPDSIDRKGMAACLRLAFREAISRIDAREAEIGTVLLDGNPLGIDEREVNVVKGDSTSASIAAASIVAKVARDELMVELSSVYPAYGFFSHKGYGAPEHIAAIKEHGLSPVHRETFCRSFIQPTLF